MSVSKWKWTPECDRGICVGDCDQCDKAVEEVTIKAKLYKQMPDPFVNLKKIEVHDPSIDQLVEEQKAQAVPAFGEWVPVKTRPMTEQERKELDEVCDWIDWASDEATMFDCKMPEDKQDVLICTESGYIFLDTCINDDYGYGLEERDDWDGVVAWMPLPEPYGGAK